MNWTRQPAARQGINRSNPLTAGLKVAISPSFGPVDVVSNRHANLVGPTLLKSPQSNGVAWKPTIEVSAGVEFSAYAPLVAGDKTIFALCNPRSQAKQKRLFSIRSSVGNDDTELSFNVNASGSAVSGTFVMFDYHNSFGSGWTLVSGASAMVGSMAAYAGTRSGNTGAMYVNGGAISSTAAGTGDVAAGLDYRLAVGNIAYYTADSSFVFDDPFVLVLAWQRALTAREHAQLAANPWQVFAPLPSRVYAFPTLSFNPAWNIAANTLIQPGGVMA